MPILRNMKRKVRLIARLDIKAPNLIKGVNLEGVRVVGDPERFACDYYAQGIDEILYMDSVASLYGRNNLTDLIKKTASQVFVPMTVGGGLRDIRDVDEVMRAGADKVSINTAAVRRPQIISEVAKRYGTQAMVLSVEAKRRAKGNGWEAYVDNGREKTGLDVIDWVVEAVSLGAGEILVTSVDREGTRKGFDVDLVSAVSSVVSTPVIASGGMGESQHATEVLEKGGADAIAIAHVLHYQKMKIGSLQELLIDKGWGVTLHGDNSCM